MFLSLDESRLNFSGEYGANQENFSKFGHCSKFKADRACGISALANSLYYMSFRAQYAELALKHEQSAECISELAAEIMRFLKPTVAGIFTLEMLGNGAVRYASSKGVELIYAVMANSSDITETREFIRFYLERDIPVMMLSWNTDLPRLRNHWVTVTGMRDDGGIKLTVSNWGARETVDLEEWVRDIPLYKGFIALM